MEPSSGYERRADKMVPRRPRVCSHEETDGGVNACACYILNIAGQNGYKVQDGGKGFRTEVNYIEIPRADGKWGTDHPAYAKSIEEFCPNAEAEYPGFDLDIEHDSESAVANYDECTSKCGGPGEPKCNRKWEK